MKILFIGDIVGSLGRNYAKEVLTTLKKSDNIALVVANADNLAHGRGATKSTVLECVNFGIDAFTGGDHLFHNKEFQNDIQSLQVARPANYYNPVSGKEYLIVKAKGYSFCVLSLVGSTFAGGNWKNVFFEAERVLNEIKRKKIKNIIVDIHSDLTSEKKALAYFLDGKVSAVLGTHTHVPTADCQVLEKGTGFVTDVGMVGSYDSVLGVKKEIIIGKFLSSLPEKFEWEEKGRVIFNSVLVDIDEKTGITRGVERRDFIG